MQPSTISWSNLVKIKSGIANYNAWPTITSPIQKTILNKKISLINTTVVPEVQSPITQRSSSGPENGNIESKIDELVEEISKVSVSHTIKTHEEIVADRKQRKILAKMERKQKLLDQKIAEVRAPKSQKIQIIDNKFLEIYHKCNNSVSKPPEPIVNLAETPKITTKNRIKQKLKNKNHISVSLVELIETKKLQKSQAETKQTKSRSIILSNPTIKRNRGKRREILKPKPLKKLKRHILAIRQLRRELRVTEEPSCQSTSKHGSVTTHPINSTAVKFSRKFRPYCDHFVTPEIVQALESLLLDLFRFQKRAYDKNNIKGCSKRRYIVGFNEVKKNLDLKKIKLLIIAPDLEPNDGAGGLDETVNNFKLVATTNEIPYVFGLSRWRIGRILFKKVPVSCVGVINYDGVDEHYKNILTLVAGERERFQNSK